MVVLKILHVSLSLQVWKILTSQTWAHLLQIWKSASKLVSTKSVYKDTQCI